MIDDEFIHVDIVYILNFNYYLLISVLCPLLILKIESDTKYICIFSCSFGSKFLRLNINIRFSNPVMLRYCLKFRVLIIVLRLFN